ncbi:hypothetical protein N9Z61_01755 [bacterium]|nr:hypothetical protein [bacterium]
MGQSLEQLNQLNQDLSGNDQVWVNTSRRLMTWHQEIRTLLLPNGPEPLHVRVSGSWGIACNAIHFIDLVAWWTQASLQSVIPTRLGEWVNSKRGGFQDVFGSLQLSYSDGSELEFCCVPGTDPTQITVVTAQGEWVIEESLGRCSGPNGQKLHGQITYQSALTAPLVRRILQEGRCDLPTLAESTAQHRPLLITLLQHWNQSQGCKDSVVPIT